MTALILVLTFVVGWLHGRMFGGWLSIRGAVMRVSPLMWSIPAWFTLPWYWAMMVSLSVLLQYDDGHRFDKPWKLALRYSQYTPLLVIATGFWPAVFIGPMSGILAWLFKRLNLPPLHLPWDTPEQQMIDGWEAYWEGTTRAMCATSWVAAAMIGTGPLF